MSRLSLGAGIAQALKARGVDTVFGIPGVHNVELYRGLQEAGITHVLARHEQGAGFMADGYARATGRPGVAFVITGPGLTNIMTPMGQAYSDSVPLLVISSCLPVAGNMPGRLHQMRHQFGAAAAVCDWSIMAEDAETTYELLDRAFAEFSSARARAKHISVPLDVLGRGGGTAPEPATPVQLAAPDPRDIDNLARILNASSKPLFIFGGGAVAASAPARAAVAKSGAAVFSTYAGRGVVGASYPLNYGATLTRPDSARVLGAADLVIAVGTELGEVDLWRDILDHSGQLVRIDIDQAVLDDAHCADIKISGDASAVLAALADQLQPNAPKWDAARTAATRAAFRAESDAERPGIVPFVDALHSVLAEDTLIYSDMTQFAYVAKEVYPMQRPGLWHHPFGFGTLGYALPAAIGGKIGAAGGAVVAIAGDSGFQYTLPELGVAAELSLCLPIILWDNGKLKEIEDAMIQSQIAPNAVVAQNPDFAQLAAAYGVAYSAPHSIAAFQDAVQAALEADGPTIVHTTPVTDNHV